MKRGARAAGALAFALVALAGTGPAAARAATARVAPAHDAACRGSATLSVGALQLLELQISYTTILARYDEKVDPRTLVRGAHAALEDRLKRCGIVDRRRVVVNPRQDASERIDTDFLTALAAYGRRLDTATLVSDVIAGELASLDDPYTLLFRPVAREQFQTFLHGESFGGIGVVLDTSQERPRVDDVIPESPAAKAGLESGDTIVTVDGTATQSLPTERLRALLRGRVGSVVEIAVDRQDLTAAGASPAPARRSTFRITREIVRDPQTIARLLDGDVGYVRLTRFGDGAAAEVASRFAQLIARGATRSVLDLRGNGGGYGDAATGVASLFVSSGTIFTTRERGGMPVVERARPGPSVRGPLVVLVDRDTASASEIVASALQDARAATIVGARTFGKGVVQSVFPLPDGSEIKMTTARYYTRDGRNIDHVGITPDRVVAEPADAHLGDPAQDPQLARALDVLGASATPEPSATASP